MLIPDDQHAIIRDLNVDAHRTICVYEYWESKFASGSYLASHIETVKKYLGDDFTRSELVTFYQLENIKPETKFISAMLWGNEAPAGSKRDSRGPWRLSKMFSKPEDAQAAIRSVSLNTENSIVEAYKNLDRALGGCGPNFFTKHFYFLGKAQNLELYPLIFDDRVANGLVKIALSNYSQLNMVQVSARRNPNSYLQYLSFAQKEAKRIGCNLDQIEYYLFNL
jgi:hypothetical protein